MSTQRIVEWLRERQRRLFPERQIFVRSNGVVRFVKLSGRQQMRLLLIPAGLFVAIAWAGVALIVQERTIVGDGQEIGRLQQERQQIAEERQSLRNAIADWSRRYEEIASDLERKHEILASLTQNRSALESRLHSMRHELAELAQQRENASSDRAATNRRYLLLREQLTHVDFLRREPLGSLRRRSLRLRLSFGGALDRSRQAAAAPTQSTALDVTADDRLLQMTADERDAARARNHDLEIEVARLENRLSVLQDMQNNLISRIANGTEEHIGALEEALSLTGLDVDDLMDRINEPNSGMGGPFISLPPVSAPAELGVTPKTHPEVTGSLDHRFEDVLGRMGFRLARLSALNTLAESLPLATPLEKYELRSKFGRRRDPFTKRWARHDGLDMTAERGAPVLATAPGVVITAGRKGPFGRMVEIDHGYGLITRYAHLYRIKVKRGERVVKLQQIGIIGSSGRSTGRHLHYEIHFDGRPLDPMTFLKAGDHVFKN